jgi:hypothetical protein
MKAVQLVIGISLLLALSGCFGAGVLPDPGDIEEPVSLDLSNVEPWLMPDESEGHAVLTNPQNPTLYGTVYSEMTWIIDVFPVLQDWDSSLPSQYAYPPAEPWLDITWELSDGEFTWDIDYGEGSYVVTLSDAGSEVTILVSENGNPLLSGAIAYDGLSGNGYIGPEQFNYSWGPSPSSSFDIRVEISTQPNLDG